MAHSKREMKPGRAHTKVSGDDEMLRTGFVDGTPLEGGKIADSHPVDLFAAARRVAEAHADNAVDPYSSQPQQQQQQRKKEQRRQEADERTTTTDKNKQSVAEAANPDAATATATEEEEDELPDRRQDVGGGPAAGGRRLGAGRPAY